MAAANLGTRLKGTLEGTMEGALERVCVAADRPHDTPSRGEVNPASLLACLLPRRRRGAWQRRRAHAAGVGAGDATLGVGAQRGSQLHPPKSGRTAPPKRPLQGTPSIRIVSS